MDACRKQRIGIAAAMTLTMAICAVVSAEDAIRLPTWIEPAYESSDTEANAVEQAAYAPAPRPFDHEPKLLTPPPRLASIGDENDSVRQVRQLEHAASTAQSHHALTRLLKRCDETLVTLEDPALRQQAERVASWARHARGRLAMQSGNAQGALDDLRAAVAANPKNTAALGDLAVTLADAGDAAAALDSLNQLLAIDPSSAIGLQNRASLRLSAGNPELAIADCDAALAKLAADAPDRPAVLTTRGVAFHSLGRLREAAADFDEALRLDPKLSPAQTARGHVYAEAGYYEQAINDYRGALDTDPESVEAYRSLAWMLATCPQRSLRSPQTAVEAAWRARRLQGSEDFLTLDASAAAHASAGEFGEAVRLQQRAIVLADASAATEAQQRLRLYERSKPYVAAGPATLKR